MHPSYIYAGDQLYVSLLSLSQLPLSDSTTLKHSYLPPPSRLVTLWVGVRGAGLLPRGISPIGKDAVDIECRSGLACVLSCEVNCGQRV